MEEFYRRNVVDMSIILLGKKYALGMFGPDEFDEAGLTFYIFKELFDIDILKDGYGNNEITKQMTNSLGNLSQYIENDSNKEKHLANINVGDLVFFHTKSLNEFQPTTNNQYPGHVGIYVGDNKFIHVSIEEEKVILSELDNKWLNKLVASRDIISSVLNK